MGEVASESLLHGKEGLFEKMAGGLRLEKSLNWSCEALGTEQSTRREQKAQNPTDRT